MKSWKEVVEESSVIFFLSCIIAAFVAGFGSYEGILRIGGWDKVLHGTYVLKSELIGPMDFKKTHDELNLLIQVGRQLKSDSGESMIWINRVLTFSQHLGLKEDREYNGNKVSTIEENIRWAMSQEKLEDQVKMTIGILEGWKAAILTRKSAME